MGGGGVWLRDHPALNMSCHHNNCASSNSLQLALSSPPLRFKNLDVVIREVTRLIHTNPVAFTGIPDAAQVLDIISSN